MSEPQFLTVEQVERLHVKLIDRFGGSQGLRDPILFEGAVIHPRNVYYYAQGDFSTLRQLMLSTLPKPKRSLMETNAPAWQQLWCSWRVMVSPCPRARRNCTTP
jgi:hypothetical protein